MRNIKRTVRFYLLKFLRLKGTPWKLALGFALGACINFYPTFGVGVLFAGLLAGLFRVNVAASLLGDLVFKSLFPLFFYFNLLTGSFILGQHRSQHLLGTLNKLLLFSHANRWELKIIGMGFIYGALINTLVLGTVLTFAVYMLFTRYRFRLARYVYRLKR